MTLDYSSAQIVYDDGSIDGVALTPLGANGQALGQVTLTLYLDPSNRPDHRPQELGALELGIQSGGIQHRQSDAKDRDGHAVDGREREPDRYQDGACPGPAVGRHAVEHQRQQYHRRLHERHRSLRFRRLERRIAGNHAEHRHHVRDQRGALDRRRRPDAIGCLEPRHDDRVVRHLDDVHLVAGTGTSTVGGTLCSCPTAPPRCTDGTTTCTNGVTAPTPTEHDDAARAYTPRRGTTTSTSRPSVSFAATQVLAGSSVRGIGIRPDLRHRLGPQRRYAHRRGWDAARQRRQQYLHSREAPPSTIGPEHGR